MAAAARHWDCALATAARPAAKMARVSCILMAVGRVMIDKELGGDREYILNSRWLSLKIPKH